VHFGGFSALDHPRIHTRTTLLTCVHVDRTCIPPTTSYKTVPFSRSDAHGCSSQLVATWNLSPSSRIRQTGWAYETFYELLDSATLKTSPMTDSLHPWREMEPRTRICPSQTSATSNHEMINHGQDDGVDRWWWNFPFYCYLTNPPSLLVLCRTPLAISVLISSHVCDFMFGRLERWKPHRGGMTRWSAYRMKSSNRIEIKSVFSRTPPSFFNHNNLLPPLIKPETRSERFTKAGPQPH